MSEADAVLPPVLLPANQPAGRFYRGGERIADFRGPGGGASDGDHVPEDWVASVTTQAGEAAVGLTTLPDGRLLREAIAADPRGWLGARHLAAFGADPLLLVKLLDPGQRLPVHVHPDDAWAAEHLEHAHGKAEAWVILAPGEVFIGLREAVAPDRLLELVEAQRVEELLALLHRREVVAGDTVYVPPGLLHAIGEGVVLAEVQQPEDLSILLEWRGFELDGATDGHLGVGFRTAIGALELAARSDAEVDALITRLRRGATILAPGSERYFRAERWLVDGELPLERGFAVLIGLDGRLELRSDAAPVPIARGTTVVVPYTAGRPLLSGHGTVLVFRPPVPGRAP